VTLPRWTADRHIDELGLAAYLDGTLAPDATDSTERHLARCSVCRADMVALRALPPVQAVPPELLARARTGATGVRSGLARTIAAAAALVVLSGIFIALDVRRRQEAPPPVFRSTPLQGFQALAPTPGEIVAAVAGMSFRWTPHREADRYVVTLVDTSGTTLATLQAWPPSSEVTWRPTAGPPRPATLVWRVRAMRGGRTIAETRPSAFEIP